MKVELELNVDSLGKPIIKVKHLDKSEAIEQRLLGQFIKNGQQTGLRIVPSCGFLSDSESFECYEIKVND